MHLDPALAAAFTGVRARDNKSESADKKAISLLFTYRQYIVHSVITRVVTHINPNLFKI